MSEFEQELNEMIEHGVPVKISPLTVEFVDEEHWVMKAVLDGEHEFVREGNGLNEVEQALIDLFAFAEEIHEAKP